MVDIWEIGVDIYIPWFSLNSLGSEEMEAWLAGGRTPEAAWPWGMQTGQPTPVAIWWHLQWIHQTWWVVHGLDVSFYHKPPSVSDWSWIMTNQSWTCWDKSLEPDITVSVKISGSTRDHPPWPLVLASWNPTCLLRTNGLHGEQVSHWEMHERFSQPLTKRINPGRKWWSTSL